ncbi:hypothetical protein [Streptomyces sp. NPDC005423]|uniref:hypothetical protein n=1 Tax=Streptomyces sp. NPDC005423 TaxID=3155343 RepID=UPI00339F46AB
MRALDPSLPDLLAETNSRFGKDVLGYRGDSSQLRDATVALFTTIRADMAFDALRELVVDERPDVVVAEMWDYVAPLLARQLDIPLVTFVHGPATAIDEVLPLSVVACCCRTARRRPSTSSHQQSLSHGLTPAEVGARPWPGPESVRYGWPVAAPGEDALLLRLAPSHLGGGHRARCCGSGEVGDRSREPSGSPAVEDVGRCAVVVVYALGVDADGPARTAVRGHAAGVCRARSEGCSRRLW